MTDLNRRKYLIEGSFADAANNHHFKRARWRRIWRQRIQDYLIAAIQNIKKLIKRIGIGGSPLAQSVQKEIGKPVSKISLNSMLSSLMKRVVIMEDVQSRFESHPLEI